MSNFVKRRLGSKGKSDAYGGLRLRHSKKLNRQPLGLLLVVLAWSLAMGWLLSLASNVQGATPNTEIGTVDVVPAQYQLGQQLYIENCSTCHIALPPAVLPSQTWKNLLEDSQHYGAQLQPLIDPPRILIWRYLQTFSRPQRKDEETPYRVKDSRYFKALHPKIKLPQPIQISSCVSCHPSATDYNFRRLSPEMENSP
ncbi:diheme cytochrome c [Calothrix sp. FACHB-1219]|uniref:diheme cytochrome c n=1 Tax=unclassified Calothrix TaxID=2619626 RepID=UPI0016869127|nr:MULTISPECIES: diheme cytochrome c [unclassified Calothrix]MBD2205433.1 diheme cytochrome c [Calothrix sp. FACHB-168]MBD2218564.1 diheme cytochrome c [Calothrix sp. FACHB-1219]